MNTLTRENRDGDRAQIEQFVAPPATVTEAGDGYTLEVEMPGVNKDGLDIWVENNELTIVGRRSFPPVDGAVLHHESRPENFRRTFELDDRWKQDQRQDRAGPGNIDIAESGVRQAPQDHRFLRSIINEMQGRGPEGLRPFVYSQNLFCLANWRPHRS
jgi:hypothetical protein